MEKQYKAILLRRFKGGMHLSLGKEGNYDKTASALHSDTLKSAIAVCALQLGLSEGGEALRDFMASFRISSAYPMAEMPEGLRYFFPIPNIVDRLKVTGGDSKKAKKIGYVEQKLFEKLLQGANEIDSDCIEGKFAFAEKPKDITDKWRVFDTDAQQHVAIPRYMTTDDSTPYFVDKWYFDEEGGLFFLTDAAGDILQKLIACLRLLADNGIGTDRTTGQGQFEFDADNDVQPITLSLPDNPTHQMALSLYCPPDNEMDKSALCESYYTLIERGGYIASPANDNHLSLRKKMVYMLGEGSIFPGGEARKGKIVDLKPDNVALQEIGQSEVNHPIWRDGTSIFVPIVISSCPKKAAP